MDKWNNFPSGFSSVVSKLCIKFIKIIKSVILSLFFYEKPDYQDFCIKLTIFLYQFYRYL
ncbi:hypothetical protein BN874_230007 [Candidatus Contendobacter odensis Run_B_J11]|uniref:Uncharacterized protein n=1 Tax=Candidatus Contendobacter odensis Run_B_J11 TaxID=1400861 RepID=A0A7U7J4H7_9GAMM|nr:hypothetical protein BN874_230007 [Candidatus Contendobacter odensis Run_B_J11]